MRETTILRAIAGFEPVHAGELFLAGQLVSTQNLTVPTEQRRVGMVFQEYALFPKPGHPLPGKYFVSGLASFPRALFDEAGGFDERFQAYGSEDLELGLRFQAAGAQIHYLPVAVGYHHHLRPLEEALAILHQYGREGIPVLLEKHPDFASDLRLDDLTGQIPAGSPPGLMRRLLTASFFFSPAVALADLFQNIPLPSILLTYLHYAAYRRGFSEYLTSDSLPNPPKESLGQNQRSKTL